MPNARLKIFVSSVQKELAFERKAVRDLSSKCRSINTSSPRADAPAGVA